MSCCKVLEIPRLEINITNHHVAQGLLENRKIECLSNIIITIILHY